MLEDRCRLLDEVIALRQERDVLLSSRCGSGHAENHCDRYRTPSYPSPPPSYHAYQVSPPSGVRLMPIVLMAPAGEYSPQYFPQPAYNNTKHLISLPPRPQVVKNVSTASRSMKPVLIGSTDESRDSSTPTSSVRPLPQQNRKLPSDFRLMPNTIVLGKGKGPKEATGNLRLKELVREQLEEYTLSGRHGKMLVISRIIEQIQLENMYQGRVSPAFVRYQDHSWWEVTEKECRIKLSATFRDLLSDKYRSSSKSKVEHRRQQRQHERDLSEFVDAIRALKTLKA
ncbi:hypothetical protein IV203_022478 [Nitzschia inconspicua]|uniref:DUF6824 domain-containing protein n=1 Tax=Nitzschia inconspicua TaxID=303405 RepID=A0A9K3PEN8_9STRA|nr:hypothetical protein IV203_022739 [Nitzschia inconspicua]KAG7344470.1 hypothetical protein IV203_022478 [Nitzschia inconspicua]